MSEKAIITDRFLRMHPEYFQKTILVAAIKSSRFYFNMKTRLCPFEANRKSRRPDFQNMEYNRIYGLVADYWDQWETHLDKAKDYSVTLANLEEMLSSEVSNGRLSQADANNIFKALELDIELVEFDQPVLATFHRNPLITAWLERRAATNLVDFAYQNRSLKPPSLRELKAMIDKSLTEMSAGENRVVRGSDLMFKSMKLSLPFPTDIKEVNRVTGGGLHPRTTTLVAGINGGGKTILAMQWAKFFATSGANVVVFTTEQPPEQLMVRALCNHLQVDFSTFTNAGLDSDMPLTERRNVQVESSIIPPDLWEKKQNEISDFYYQVYSRLFFVDWSGTSMAIHRDFDAEMSRIEETGWNPDAVVFDWIGGGLASVRGGNGEVPLEVRHLYKEGIETIINHGKRSNRVMIAMAQLNKTLVGPKKKAVVMSDLAECKNMTDNVTNFVGISALRQNDSTSQSSDARPTVQLKQFLNLDKARMGPGGLVPVEAVFRLQCFKGLTNRL